MTTRTTSTDPAGPPLKRTCEYCLDTYRESTALHPERFCDKTCEELDRQEALNTAKRNALDAIVAELDGQIWTPKTLARIAQHLRVAGYVIRDSDGEA